MKRKNTFLIPATIIFLIVICIIFIYKFIYSDTLSNLNNEISGNAKYISLESQTEGMNNSIPEGKGINYSLQNLLKTNKRLASFYKWNLEDPLFWGPGFDPVMLEKSVNEINSEQVKFLKLTGGSAQIYPITFLQKVAKTAKIYTSFLANPSEESASTLIFSQLDTVKEYQKALEILKAQISKEEDIPLIGFSMRVDKYVTLSDLDVLLDNATLLRSEIVKREGCLKGIDACKIPSLVFKQPDPMGFVSKKPESVEKKIVYFPIKSDELINGPYASDTPCYGWGSSFTYPKHYFYIGREKLQDGRIIANIQLADNIFFKKIPSNAVNPVEKVFLNKGIPYIMTASTNLYLCPYSGNLSEVNTLDFFLYTKKPLMQEVYDVSRRKEFNAARKAEDDFFKNKFPSYAEALYLAQNYAYTYRFVQDNGLLEDRPDLKYELLNRYLMIQRKLAGIDQIFNYSLVFISDTRQIAQVLQGREKTQLLSLMYAYKNFYGLFFLPFSSSFYYEKTNLSYSQKINVKGVVGENGAYIDYISAVKKYNNSDIAKWFTSRQSIFDSLNK